MKQIGNAVLIDKDTDLTDEYDEEITENGSSRKSRILAGTIMVPKPKT